MSTDYDPKLQALFSQASQEFDRDAFTREVMTRIDRGRRATVVLWSVLGVVGIAIVALLAGPLSAAFGFASQLLPVSLVEVETRWLQLLLSPINSVAAAIAVGALLLRRFYRWIFR
jgi:hypothetical protein